MSEPIERQVYFSFTVSMIFFSYQGRVGPVSSAAGLLPGVPYSILTLLLGWWGIPWGPIRTVQSLIINFGGGEPLGGYQPELPTTPVLAAGTCPSCGATEVTRAFGKAICSSCKTRW